MGMTRPNYPQIIHKIIRLKYNFMGTLFLRFTFKFEMTKSLKFQIKYI
jgi:hypothetical protein